MIVVRPFIIFTQVQTFSTVGEPSGVLRHKKTTGLVLVNAKELVLFDYGIFIIDHRK